MDASERADNETVVGIPSAGVAREVMRAVVRAALAIAYQQQVKRGYTLEVMAARVGTTPQQIERWMMVPGGLSLSALSDVCFAMACEPTFALADGKAALIVQPWPDGYYTQGTEAGTATTGTGVVHDGPVLAEDAPELTPGDHHG